MFHLACVQLFELQVKVVACCVFLLHEPRHFLKPSVYVVCLRLLLSQ